ncbi:hypothetical protein F5Y11DRAFT_341680 [Daldinia sp. FL1419]|nr:hypothetical protein F5Y11DRAFT_341680 [Daldinia sp. FL1419]
MESYLDVESLLHKILERSPEESLLEHFDGIARSWVDLISVTTLPANLRSSDTLVEHAFTAVGRAIDDGGLLARLAHIRLLEVFESLESLIRSERKKERRQRNQERRQRNQEQRQRKQKQQKSKGCLTATHLAMEIVTKMFGMTAYKLANIRRIASRWRLLAGSWPFLLLIYSGSAENIMYVNARL